MKRNSNSVLAVLLIGCGVIILLSLLPLQGWLSWLIPLAMVGLGIYGIRGGRSAAGWVILILGLIFLFGKMWGILAFLAAIVFIWIGWSLLNNRKIFH